MGLSEAWLRADHAAALFPWDRNVNAVRDSLKRGMGL
jgi:hypothetical protein